MYDRGYSPKLAAALAGLVVLAGPALPQSRFNEDSVPPLEVFEGMVEGLGTDGAGLHHLLVRGRKRVLAPDSAYRDIVYGDWVTLACSQDQCWVWIIDKDRNSAG